MSVNMYKTTQNQTDTGLQLSVRAVRSILLYCQDCGNKELSKKQRIQSAQAGQILCDALVVNMIDTLPEKEQQLLMTIFTKTSQDLYDYELYGTKSLVENERAIIKVLDIISPRKS